MSSIQYQLTMHRPVSPHWANIRGSDVMIYIYFIFGTKVSLAKAMVFPVVMYRHKSWTINKAEHWKIDAFELWCWRRLLKVPWAARRSNQSTLKESSPENVQIEGSLTCCSPWNCKVGQDWVTEWQQWWFKNRGMVSWYRLESVSLGANVTL